MTGTARAQAGVSLVPGERPSEEMGERGRTVVAQQDGGGVDAVLLGELDDGLGGEQRAARAAEGAVRHEVDALLLAEVVDLLLGQLRVVLDLVDGRDHRGVRQELLEILLAVL